MPNHGTIARICKGCGTEFFVWLSDLAHGRGLNCSRACRELSMYGTQDHRYWSKVNKTPTCWLWLGVPNWTGYGRYCVGKKHVPAHRHALESKLNRPLRDGFRALHTCDVRHCVRNDGDEGVYEINGVVRIRFGHLWEGTIADNSADMMLKGRAAQGQSNSATKLTDDAVRDIRIRYAQGGITAQALAAEHGVGQTSIYRIVLRQGWKHLP